MGKLTDTLNDKLCEDNSSKLTSSDLTDVPFYDVVDVCSCGPTERNFNKDELEHLRNELFKISLEIINPYCPDCKRLDGEINKLLSYCDKLLKELEDNNCSK